MNVLVLSPTAAPGGAERSLTALIRRLPDYGITTHTVILESGRLVDWLADAGCEVTVLRSGRTRQLPTSASVIRELANLLCSFDVIISNHSKGHVYGGLAAKIARRPSIWWQREIPKRGKIELCAAVISSNAVVCSSADALAAQRRLTPRRRIQLIHPGINLDEVTRSSGSGMAIRQSMGWESAPVVGIVGRLQPGKGQDIFLPRCCKGGREAPRSAFSSGWRSNPRLGR